MLKMFSRAPGRPLLALSLGVALLGAASTTLAKIDYTKSQQETIAELVEQLEERHYAGLRYDDELSSQHLDNYINSLDGGKMFFLASDIEEFDKYRTVMDDQLPRGKLDGGFFPLLRHPEIPAVCIVPERWWSPALLEAWR